MDVDAEEVQQSRVMPLISYFSTEPASFAWRGTRPQELEERRALLNDAFIFDLILSAGGIRNADTLFPPADVDGLERLLDAIESSTFDTLKKESLVYYLLKWQGDGQDQVLKERRCIPPQFAALSEAYWFLDAGVNIARAVSILSDCRLKQDYSSKILHAISLAPNPNPLIIRYVKTAKPFLTEPNDIDLYAKALADVNFLEAWQFQRSFSQDDVTRRRLLHLLVEWCTMPVPRSKPLAYLLAFPLSAFEESVINSLALSIPSPSSFVPAPQFSASALGILQDLVFTRLIQSGKYSEAIKMDRRFSLCSSNSPATLREAGADTSVHARIQERSRTVQDIYSILPSAEKALLDAELEELVKGKANAAVVGSQTMNGIGNGSVNTSAPAHDLSMSSSWEDVHAIINPSPSMMNGSSTPLMRSLAQSRAQQNGAPLGSVASPSWLPQPHAGGSDRPSNDPLRVSALGGFPNPSHMASGAGLSASTRQPRTSFPQVPVSLASSLAGSTSRPRASLPGALPTPLAGTSLFGGLPKQPPKNFTPASSVRNAFYDPPPDRLGRSVNGVKRRLDGAVVEQPMPPRNDVPNGDMLYNGDGKDSEDVVMNGDEKTHIEEEGNRVYPEEIGPGEDDEQESLGYSLFSQNKPARGEGKKIPKQVTKRQQPPGAFMPHSLSDDDGDEGGDDEGHEAHETEGHEPRRPVREARTPRISAPRATKSKLAASKAKSRGTRSTHDSAADLVQSLPGALIDDDAEDIAEAEEEPAPLPARTTRAKTSGRKSRSSVALSDGGDEDDDSGMQTRRRSSRLSATHTQPATVSNKPTKGTARRRR